MKPDSSKGMSLDCHSECPGSKCPEMLACKLTSISVFSLEFPVVVVERLQVVVAFLSVPHQPQIHGTKSPNVPVIEL